VQKLTAQLEGSTSSQHAQHGGSDSGHLTEVNRQLEEHVTSLDMQLEQAQQELQAAHAEVDHLTHSLAAQGAQHEDHNSKQAQLGHADGTRVQADLQQWQEECTAKGLQVCHLLLPLLCCLVVALPSPAMTHNSVQPVTKMSWVDYHSWGWGGVG